MNLEDLKPELSQFNQRYSRQLILKGWSFKKQKQIKQTTVCINGIYKLPYYSLACLGIEKFFIPNNAHFSDNLKEKLLSFNSNIEFISVLIDTDTLLYFDYEKDTYLDPSILNNDRTFKFILSYQDLYLNCIECLSKKTWSLNLYPRMNIELSYSVLINKVIFDFI